MVNKPLYFMIMMDHDKMDRELKDLYRYDLDSAKRIHGNMKVRISQALKDAGLRSSYRFSYDQREEALAMAEKMRRVTHYPVMVVSAQKEA